MLLFSVIVTATLGSVINPQEIASKEGFVAVLFTSSWCDKCEEVMLSWNEIQDELLNPNTMIEASYEEGNEQLFATYGINNPPAMVIFTNQSKPIHVKDDYSDAPTLRTIIEKCSNFLSLQFDNIDRLAIPNQSFNNFIIVYYPNQSIGVLLSQSIFSILIETGSFTRYAFLWTSRLSDVTRYLPDNNSSSSGVRIVLLRSFASPREITNMPFTYLDVLRAPLPLFSVYDVGFNNHENGQLSMVRAFIDTNLPRIWFLSSVRTNEEFFPHPGIEHVPILFVPQPFVQNVKKHFKINILKRGQCLLIYQSDDKTYLSDQLFVGNERNVSEIINHAINFQSDVLEGSRSEFYMSEELIHYYSDTDYLYLKQYLTHVNIKHETHTSLSEYITKPIVGNEKILVTLIYSAKTPLDRSIFKSFCEVAESLSVFPSNDVKFSSLDWERNFVDEELLKKKVHSYPCILLFVKKDNIFSKGRVEVYIGDYSSAGIVMFVDDVATEVGINILIDHTIVTVDKPIPQSDQSIINTVHSDLTTPHFVRVPFTHRVYSVSPISFLFSIIVILPTTLAALYALFSFCISYSVFLKYRVLLRLLYGTHCPERIEEISDLLKTYEGAEKSFYKREVQRLNEKIKTN